MSASDLSSPAGSPPAFLARLFDIIATRLRIDASVLTPDTTWTDLNADSMAQIDIMFEIEEAFGIDVSPEDAETFRTIGDAIIILRDHHQLA